MSQSIHDNTIYAYQVVADESNPHTYTICLHTEFLHLETIEYTDVLFSHVIAHYFENVRAGNILYDIQAGTMEQCYTLYEDIFTRLTNEAWPIPYTDTTDLFQRAKLMPGTIFFLTSSYGLSGWIWAETMHIIPQSQKARIFA
jgi:hypothetical protein